jgi:hypothetical protein
VGITTESGTNRPGRSRWKSWLSMQLRLVSLSRLLLFRRRKRHGCLPGQKQKCERLLQVQRDAFILVVQIANRDVLADVKFEVAAAGSEDESTGNSRRKDYVLIHQPLDVLDDGIAVIARFT